MPTYSHGDSHTASSNLTAIEFRAEGGGNGGVVEGTVSSPTGGTTYYFRGSNSGGDPTGNTDTSGFDYIDVREGGTSLSDQILVAAGAGARADATGSEGGGGAGGANTGESGSSAGNAEGGGGGTQSSGGAGGSSDGVNGFDGSREFGGDAAGFFDDTSGAGGGGYYGGGSGGSGDSGDAGGGGGGSNYVAGGLSSTLNQRGGGSGPTVTVTELQAPSGVALDSLTETGDGEVQVEASATAGYSTGSTWTVYRSTDGSQGSSIHTETGDGDLSYTDTAAPTGDLVYYTVELSNSGGTDSDQSSLIVRAATVTNLTVAAHDATSVDLNWDDNPGPDVDQYELYRNEASGAGFVDYTQIDTSGSSAYTDTGLENGERFFYTVLATSSGDSSYDSRYPGEVDQVTDLPAPTIDSTEDTA